MLVLLAQGLSGMGANCAVAQIAAPATSITPTASTVSLPGNTGATPVLQQGHSGGISQTAFAPLAARMATASLDGTARLWDLKSGVLVGTFAHGPSVTRIAFARGAKTLVTYGTGILCFWNAETARLLTRVTLAVNPASLDGTVVLLGEDRVSAYGPRGQVRVWDSGTSKLQNTYNWLPDSRQKYGRPLTFTPDGNAVVFQREELEDNDQNAQDASRAAVGPDGKPAGPPRRYKLVTLQLVDARTGQVKTALQPFEQRSEQGYNPQTAFSPDGAIMAQTGDDGLVHLWNLNTNRALQMLRAGRLPTHFLVFSPDGRRLATASRQVTKEAPGDVSVWDVLTGKRIVALPGLADVAVHALCFDRTGRTLAVSAPNWHDRKLSLQLWDAQTGKVRLAVPGGMDVDTLVFAPDEALLVGSDPEGGLRIWNAQSGQAMGEFASGRQAFSPARSPDGTRLAYVGYNGWLHIWDAGTGALLDSLPTNKDFGPNDRYLQTEAVFAPDGRSVAYVVSHKGSAEIYDLAAHTRREIFPADPRNVVAAQRVLFAPDGRTLALSASDGKTRFVDAASGSVLATIEYSFAGDGGTGERGTRFTTDGKSFVALNNSSILIYNVADGSLRTTISPGRFQDGVRLSADGALLAAMLDREVQLYDVATGRIKAAIKITDGEYLFSVLLSPDGKQVLTRGSQRLRVWDVDSGQTVATLQSPPPMGDMSYPYYGVSPVLTDFSAENRYVALRLPTGQAIVWETASGHLLPDVTPRILDGFAPALRRPLSVLGASLVVHDPRTGSPLVLLTAFPELTFKEQQALNAAPDAPRKPVRFAWLAQTPDGFFDGSPNVTRFLRSGAASAPAADTQLEAFHRPEQVQKALRLERPPQARDY